MQKGYSLEVVRAEYTLTLSHSHSHTLTLSHSHTLTLSLSLTLTHTHTRRRGLRKCRKGTVSRWCGRRLTRRSPKSAPAPPPATLVNFFFFTLVTGRKRSLSLTLSDTRVYEPQIRSCHHLGLPEKSSRASASHFGKPSTIQGYLAHKK